MLFEDSGMYRPQSPGRHRRAGGGVRPAGRGRRPPEQPKPEYEPGRQGPWSLYQGAAGRRLGASSGVASGAPGAHLFRAGPNGPRSAEYDTHPKGQSYAETLIREEHNRVEGHYWLALNLCGQADVGGKLLGRKLLPRIMEELQTAIALDAAYDQAGAHRVLGCCSSLRGPRLAPVRGRYAKIPATPPGGGAFVPGHQHQPSLPGPNPVSASMRPAWQQQDSSSTQIHPRGRQTPGPGGGPARGPAPAGGNQGWGSPVSNDYYLSF